MSSKQTPVFVSSPNLASITGAKQAEWNSIYNYMMLKNLKDAMGVSYKTVLDLDSVLYMDIYGNIITSNGLVVIPAMSNPTNQKAGQYSIYSVGFIDLYNRGGFEMSTSFKNSETYMPQFFAEDEETGKWVLKKARFDNIFIEMNDLSVSDEGVLKTFLDISRTKTRKNLCLDFNKGVYIITEVLRGAPIENINLEFEGLKGNVAINKAGLYSAYKLEEISEALMSTTNGNSLISLPNPAFMTGVEYVIFFIMKIVFLLLLVLLFIKIYLDAVEGQLGLKSMGSFLLSVVGFIVSAFMIPYLMDLSYYQANKNLLQKEVSYITLLNLEKKSEGREIGLISVDSFEPSTKLYLKVDDLNIPWYSIVDEILLNNSINTVKEAYEQEQESSLMTNLPGMIQKGNGLYISVDEMFDGVRVEWNDTEQMLYTVTSQTPYASFISPYYAFLDQLVARVNEYNTERGIKNYSVKVMNQGAVRTVGLVQPYFTSIKFWDQSQDLLGMKDLYGIETSFVENSVFSSDNKSAMKNSKWYKDDMDLDVMEEVLDNLQEYAKAYVNENKSLLDKVSDESFLKTMALSLAVEYNRKARVGLGNAIEIYDVDARDLIRLSMAKKQVVMVDAPKSFARFVYDNAGGFGVIVTALLLVVYFVTSLVKPLSIFLIIAVAVASVVVRRLIRKDKTSAIEGFLITIALLCGINLIYSVVLKFSMMLPNFNVTPQVSCVIQILIQIAYILILGIFVTFVVKDWESVGFNYYSRMALSVGEVYYSTNTKVSMDRPNVYESNSAGMKRSFFKRKGDDQSLEDGTSLLNSMKEKDKKRKDNYGKTFERDD